MALDTATRVGDLDNSLPADGDFVYEGDDHLRTVKTSLINSFPNLTVAKGGIANAESADLPLGKKNATSAPTANDDSGDGYAVGSIWVDIIADKPYICVDSTVAAATWKEIGQDEVAPSIIFPSTSEIQYAGPSTPAGWTVRALNDYAVRIQSSRPAGGATGGVVAFETAFASKAVSGSNTFQSVNHNHPIIGSTGAPSNTSQFNFDVSGTPLESNTHTHAINFTSGNQTQSHTHTFIGTAIDLDVRYQKFCVIRKT